MGSLMHEIKTPLSQTSQFLQNIYYKAEEEELIQDVKKAMTCIDLMVNVTNDVQDYI